MRRGEYRGIYTVIHGDEDFLAFSSDARHLVYALKIELGRSGIEFIPAFREQLREITALSKAKVDRGLQELQEAGWLVIDEFGRILWLRNGMKFEPSISLSNKNHRKSILKHLRGMPERPIVRDFARHYSLPDPFHPRKELGDDSPQEELPLDEDEPDEDEPQDVGGSDSA